MLKGVTNKSELKKLQHLLEGKLKNYATDRVAVSYSSRAGVSQEVNAYYSDNHNLWWYFDGNNTQYWNPFGVGKPRNHEALTGRAQINMPKEGYNGRIGGAFAYDEDGNLFLMHNGGIGGGVKGISKSTFLSWFTGKLHEVDFDGKTAEYFIVSDFRSQNILGDIKFFVEKVYEFKLLNKQPYKPTPYPRKKVNWLEYGESELRNPYNLPERTVLRGADHAIITNGLIKSLNALGLKVGRNRFMDAFIVDQDDNLSHLFEVKNMLSTQSLYTAIGQLMMYGLHYKTKLILVVDVDTRQSLLKDLRQLGIECLTFTWVKEKPVFKDLSRTL